jgi:hypothetical protein
VFFPEKEIIMSMQHCLPDQVVRADHDPTMTGSLTDGAQALFLWKNMGMTKRSKRARHPAQLARLTIDVAIGEVEDGIGLPKTKKRATQPLKTRRVTKSARRKSQ